MKRKKCVMHYSYTKQCKKSDILENILFKKYSKKSLVKLRSKVGY